MRVARTLNEAAQFGPTAVAIGNFDGVHIAHRELLSTVLRACANMPLRAVRPDVRSHPATIVAPERTQRLLSTQSRTL